MVFYHLEGLVLTTIRLQMYVTLAIVRISEKVWNGFGFFVREILW